MCIRDRIIEMQKRKKELADMFVENNSGGLSQMSKEDILSLSLIHILKSLCRNT